MRKNTPAVQAYLDQQRRLITDDIRRQGVHLNYISVGRQDLDCACCTALGTAEGEVPDSYADLVGGPEGLPERLTVPFCYTTGLYGVGHPELVVVGLSPQASADLFDGLLHRVLGHGGDLTPGEVVEVDHGRRVTVEDLPNPEMVLFQTNGYYERPPWASVPAYHLTWADPAGRFPWDEGHLPLPWPQPRPGEYRA